MLYCEITYGDHGSRVYLQIRKRPEKHAIILQSSPNLKGCTILYRIFGSSGPSVSPKSDIPPNYISF